jgi:ubiquinone biosynthesis protein
LVLAPETIAAIGRSERRKSRGRTIALWIIAATFIGVLFSLQYLR